MKIVVMLLVPLVVAAEQNPLERLLPPQTIQTSGFVKPSAGKSGSMVLVFEPSDQPSTVTIPVPKEAADFTQYGSLQFTFRSDSTIFWELRLHNAKGETTTFRVQPYERVRVNASVPLSFLTHQFMNNRNFTAYWMSNWRNHIDVTSITSMTFAMRPNRRVTLEVGPFSLSKEVVPDSAELASPVVDQFGQWMNADWPGKVRSLDDLRREWSREDAGLKSAAGFEWSRYGGLKSRQLSATGFFRVEEVDGRWWIVDPDGHPFFSSGVDCIRLADGTRVKGREKLFASLPPIAGETADFYTNNLTLRYGAEKLFTNWRHKTEQRLRAWGFNTVGNWSDQRLFSEAAIPYVTNVALARGQQRWEGFPDIYSDDYRECVSRDAVEQTTRYKNDSYLIGYFIGNEPHWQNRNLIDRILNDPAPSETQKFVREYLKQGSREALMEKLSRDYFKITVDALKKADPKHLVLGIRWAGSAPDPVLRANDVFDVFSINIYRFEPSADHIAHIYKQARRPILIGEFHFGAAERGYAPALVMVKDQTERGAAYQYYVEKAAANPVIIGTHYFQLYDQPVTGRFDGENYNLGFVNQQDISYPEIVRFAQNAHRRMYDVHAGKTPPVTRTAKVR